MAMTVDERLASIDTGLAVLGERFEAHTQADDDNFTRLSTQLDSIEKKVDELRLAEASRVALIDSNRRNASMLGGGVAAVIVGLVESFKYFTMGS